MPGRSWTPGPAFRGSAPPYEVRRLLSCPAPAARACLSHLCGLISPVCPASQRFPTELEEAVFTHYVTKMFVYVNYHIHKKFPENMWHYKKWYADKL